MHYLDLLDQAEAITKPDLYLEIGSRSGKSLARRSCNFVGVDPEFKIIAPAYNSSRQMHFMQMTSDDFFASEFLPKLGLMPQMAFIDGMHLFEFALRDFINSEQVMHRDGLIFFHDVLPFNAGMTARTYVPEMPWTGDVWKTILALVETRPDLRVDVIPAAKTGLACVRGLKGREGPWLKNYDEIIAHYQSLDISNYGIGNYLSKIKIVTPEVFIASLRPRN
ncbi:MAG: class I SAM-dependent methyltransferase [Pseudomonadota bacterium]